MSQETFAMMKQEAELKAEIENLQEQKKPIERQIESLRSMLAEVREERMELEKQEAKITKAKQGQSGKTQQPQKKKSKDDDLYSKFLAKFKDLEEGQKKELLKQIEQEQDS